MPPTYRAERSALLKILLHAARHPASSVNGVLLGTIKTTAAARASDDSPGSPRSSGPQAAVEIVDAVPFFHTFLSLAPSLEVALVQVDAYARAKGLQVVGYYHANEHISDTELGPVGRKVADRIHQQSPHSCALLVDNSKLQDYLQMKAPTFLQLWLKEGQRGWSPAPAGSLQGESGTLPQLFLDFHGQGRHHKLADFDDHLNDIKKDWRNLELLS